MKEIVTKNVAIARLKDAGYLNEADGLERWFNVDRTSGGWDGWFQAAYPSLVDIVWNHEARSRADDMARKLLFRALEHCTTRAQALDVITATGGSFKHLDSWLAGRGL